MLLSAVDDTETQFKTAVNLDAVLKEYEVLTKFEGVWREFWKEFGASLEGV
jgi:hypothetical protein